MFRNNPKANKIIGIILGTLCVFSLFLTPILGGLIIGGVISQGILGGFSGKVGPVVGGKWKDIDYMRSYVVPSNPDTPAQQAVRLKFANLVVNARSLLSSLLQPFWDMFYSNMSGFNAWISQNYSLADATGVIDETAIMAKGTLEPVPTVTATYDTSNGQIAVTYGSGISGNGDTDDFAQIVVYDKTDKRFFFTFNDVIRGDGSNVVTSTTGLTATNVFVWVFCSRGTGSELIVSDSLGAVCTAV